MSRTKSQLWLLVSVGILVGLYHVYLQAIIALRERHLVSLSLVHLCVIGVLTAVAACAAALLGRTRAVSRPVAILLAGAAGGLAAAIYDPKPGVASGLLLGAIVCYTPANLLLRTGYVSLALLVGSVGVSLARRVYIDMNDGRWAMVLMIVVAVVGQTILLMAPLPARYHRAQHGRRWPSRLAKWCLVLVSLIAVPLSWMAGWHGEMFARLHAIQAKGGSLPTWRTTPAGVRYHDGYVRLRNPTRRDARTLAAFQNIRALLISGDNTDDAALAALPPLPEVWRLEIVNTRVTGKFLADSRLLPGLRNIIIHSSPFADDSLRHLAERREIRQLDLRGTKVTSAGLVQLAGLPFWPQLMGDVPFGAPALRLFQGQLPNGDTRLDSNAGLKGGVDNRVFSYAEFSLNALLPEAVAALNRLPKQALSHVTLSLGSLPDRELIERLKESNNIRLTLVDEPVRTITVTHMPAMMNSLHEISQEENLVNWWDRDGRNRWNAGYSALERIGATAVPPLVEELEREEMRWFALRAIGLIGLRSREAEGALLRLLEDDTFGFRTERRVEIMRYLDHTGPPAADFLPVLIRLLDDDSPEVRYEAASLLRDPERDLGLSGVEAAAKLIEMLKDQDWQRRLSVVEALGHIGPSAVAAVPMLIELLDDPSMRTHAAIALADIGTPKAWDAALPVLIQTLDHPSPYDRRWAAAALRDTGTQAAAAVPGLIRMLQESNDGTFAQSVHLETRAAAADALASLAQGRTESTMGRAIVDALTSLFETTDDAVVRKLASDTLKTIKAEAAVHGKAK